MEPMLSCFNHGHLFTPLDPGLSSIQAGSRHLQNMGQEKRQERKRMDGAKEEQLPPPPALSLGTSGAWSLLKRDSTHRRGAGFPAPDMDRATAGRTQRTVMGTEAVPSGELGRGGGTFPDSVR